MAPVKGPRSPTRGPRASIGRRALGKDRTGVTESLAEQKGCSICGSYRVASFTRRGASYARCRSCQCVSRLMSPEEYRTLAVTYDADPMALHAPRDELRTLI